MPFAAEDRAECLAILASDPDTSISDRAQNALLSLDLASLFAALGRLDADPRLFTYCAVHCADKLGIADALAKNPSCPPQTVARAATHLTSAGIQALLDDLERFCSDEHLVAAVAKSTAANAEQRALLDEMNKGALSEAEIAEAAEAAADIEPDPVRRETLTQKITRMNVVQRLTVALKGGREERMFLIRDPNKLVQRCVLQSPRLTETEVENFAAQTNLSQEVLRTISMSRVFMKSYIVAKNLTNNPKTPLDVSLHLMVRLNAPDLMKLSTNKNIPDTLRSSAQKLHRKRKMGG
jgi:DNA-binding transcriptional regulator YhcF (GntR family)